jgi:hypothetical protein
MPDAPVGGRGIQASSNLRRWAPFERRQLGLEAYWIDAAEIGLPSDYFHLAADGPAMPPTPRGPCRSASYEVVRDHGPQLNRARHSPGDYVATASGTCLSRTRPTVWASFVAAPGYGPVRSMGIPRSGLYYAFVMIPDGPRAKQRAEHLLGRITFGQTPVAEFLATARGQR